MSSYGFQRWKAAYMGYQSTYPARKRTAGSGMVTVDRLLKTEDKR